MNWQIIVVGIIVFFAFLYAVNLIWTKVKSFSPKSACGGNCGCDAKAGGKSLNNFVKQR